jgi:hypothetical protein
MVHARGSEELEARVESMASLAEAEDWRVLTSLKELKKSSLEYFPDSRSC